MFSQKKKGLINIPFSFNIRYHSVKSPDQNNTGVLMLNLLTLATVFCPFFSANKPSWRNRRNYGQILPTELQIFHRAESQGCLAEGLSIRGRKNVVGFAQYQPHFLCCQFCISLSPSRYDKYDQVCTLFANAPQKNLRYFIVLCKITKIVRAF